MIQRTVHITLPLTCTENPATLIPPGTYDVRMTYSPKFGKMMPEILRVPATPDYPSADGRTSGLRSGIRLHLGTQSSGCLLMTEPQYSLLRTLLQTYETLTITIADSPPSTAL